MQNAAVVGKAPSSQLDAVKENLEAQNLNHKYIFASISDSVLMR